MELLQILLISLIADKTILLQPICLILGIFGFQTYSFTNQSEINSILKILKIYTASIKEGEKDAGTIIGKWFIGYIHNSGENEKKQKTLYLIISRKKYKILKNQVDSKRFNADKNNDKPVKVKVWNCKGNKWWREYESMVVDWSHLNPYPNQINVVEEIIKEYHKSRHQSLVVYAYGLAGTGKTNIGYLIAKHFKSHYFNGWKPTNEGNRFSDARLAINPEKDSPLIVGVNEINHIVYKLDKMKPVKDVEREFDGKEDWNNFFDSFGIGFYQNTIIIATGNVPIEEIDEYDISLMRAGRFDMIIEMKKEESIITFRRNKKKND